MPFFSKSEAEPSYFYFQYVKGAGTKNSYDYFFKPRPISHYDADKQKALGSNNNYKELVRILLEISVRLVPYSENDTQNINARVDNDITIARAMLKGHVLRNYQSDDELSSDSSDEDLALNEPFQNLDEDPSCCNAFINKILCK